MRFHYVPTTYRGKKFGRGYFGGSYIGYGRICGGSLADLGFTPKKIDTLTNTPVNIPVSKEQVLDNIIASAPPALTPELIERAKKIIAYAEATGKAQPITKKEAGFWSGLKNIGSKAWNATKAVGKTALNGAWAATKYGVPLALKTAAAAAPVALSAATFATTNPVGKALLNMYAPGLQQTINKLVPGEYKKQVQIKELDKLMKDVPFYKQAKHVASNPLVQRAYSAATKTFKDYALKYAPKPIKEIINLKPDYKEKIIPSEIPEEINGPINLSTHDREVFMNNPSEPYNEDEIEEVSDNEEEPPTSFTESRNWTAEEEKAHREEAQKEEEQKEENKPGFVRRALRKALDLYLKTPGGKNDAAIFNKVKSWFGYGSGYRRKRRGRFRKGSIEAKLYMARLRAMRANKKRTKMSGGVLHKNIAAWGAAMPNLYTNFRGSGLNGGMLRGLTREKLENIIDDMRKKKTKKADIEWKDASKHTRKTRMTYENLWRMLQGLDNMQNFFKYNRNGKERSKGEQKKMRQRYAKRPMRPQTRMSHNLMANIIDLYQNKADYDHIKDYLKVRTTPEFRKKWLRYNYYDKKYPKNKETGGFSRVNRLRRDLLSQFRYIRKKKEGKIKDKYKHILLRIPNGFDDLPVVLSDNAAEGFAKDPSVGTPK